MKNAEILMEELEKHADAKEILKEYGKIETVSDYAGALLFAAKRLGIETQMDAAELAGYLESMEAAERETTEQAAGDMMALEDDDLEDVAGGVTCDGKNTRARYNKDSGRSLENAFDCWINDKCATWFYNE
ncbi:MAG: hypothetical protein IK082_12295 [Oscillospiraceae bacterium]|nr:hypothetical protein [Oscillospiraceae bacterium]